MGSLGTAASGGSASGETKMDDLLYVCPICQGKVLFEDVIDLRGEESLLADKLYCPHCEMLVEPVIHSTAIESERIGRRDAGSENRGRSREGGSNAGGSQAGDLADQGASPWRRDPLEGERNSWRHKA
jgi:hypothetical protein